MDQEVTSLRDYKLTKPGGGGGGEHVLTHSTVAARQAELANTSRNTLRGSHHVDELSDGEAEVNQHHVGDVCHGPGQLVVAHKQVLEQSLLRVGLGTSQRTHWREEGVRWLSG